MLVYEETSRTQCLDTAKWQASKALRPIIHIEIMQQHDYVSLERMNKWSGVIGLINLKEVRRYKRTSDQQSEVLSDILMNNKTLRLEDLFYSSNQLW